MNVNNTFTSIEQISGKYLKQSSVNDVKPANHLSFLQALDEAKSSKELTFTKHATNRLTDRNILLSDEQLNRLEQGVNLAGQKGIKESLVLLDNLAFIVNTKNNTVITAMSSDNTSENVYTNIDGAVII